MPLARVSPTSRPCFRRYSCQNAPLSSSSQTASAVAWSVRCSRASSARATTSWRSSFGRWTEPTAEAHYGEHADKPFFSDLVEFITGGPLVAAVIEGPDSIEAWRTMMGVTNPIKSAPGTIRGDLANVMTENLVHGSDSPESAAREIALVLPVALSGHHLTPLSWPAFSVVWAGRGCPGILSR